MSKNKFTPGPWAITNLNGSKHITFTPVYAGREVKVEIAKVTGLKNYDNSALLAAAPELLAALEELYEEFERMTSEDYAAETVAKARAAIAKARGEL